MFAFWVRIEANDIQWPFDTVIFVEQHAGDCCTAKLQCCQFTASGDGDQCKSQGPLGEAQPTNARRRGRTISWIPKQRFDIRHFDILTLFDCGVISPTGVHPITEIPLPAASFPAPPSADILDVPLFLATAAAAPRWDFGMTALDSREDGG